MLLDKAELRKLAESLDELAEAREINKLGAYSPYLKQMEFHALGRTKSERLLKAGNQLGKTLCGSAEAAYHLTGRYPEWWSGRTWSRPIRMWVGGESAGAVRDTTQKLLLGDLAANRANLGTGLIPQDCLPEDPSWSRGVDSGVDNIAVRHVSGGFSVVFFKSYEQGRTKWQGDTIDLVWFDEEAPSDVYSEGLTRLTATNGAAFMTFTPLKGMSTVVRRFLSEQSIDRAVVNMTMDDAPHMTEEMREKALRRYPDHERATRASGDIMQGMGRVFDVADSVVACTPFTIPDYWKHIMGLDLGHGQSESAHPTAAVWMAVDPDHDILYVYRTYRIKGGNVPTHASALRSQGSIPISWPADAWAGDKNSGTAVKDLYKAQGCFMLPSHAKWEDGSVSVAAGIVHLQQRIEAGTFKVFTTCPDWFEEFRGYHTDENNKIVALNDDLLSATRYALMSRKFAKPVDRSGSFMVKRPRQAMASGLDFNPLA